MSLLAQPWGLDPTLLEPSEVIQDPIHGSMEFSRLDLVFIGWPMFQRLGWVALNSGADAAYPNNTAPRRAHALGTVAAFQTLFDQLVKPSIWHRGERSLFDEWRDAGNSEYDYHVGRAMALGRLMALLHDLLHISKGHPLEDVFDLFGRHDANKPRFDRIWSTLPDHLGDLLERGRITPRQHESLVPVIDGDLFRALRSGILRKAGLPPLTEYQWVADLVNKFPGADVVDYVPRDNHNAGRPFALDRRWMPALTVLPSQHPDYPNHLAIRVIREGKPRPEIIDSLIRLLLDRFDNYKHLYFHHRVLRKVATVARAVEDLIEHRSEVLGSWDQGTASVEDEFLTRGDEGILLYLAERYQAEQDRCTSEESKRRLAHVSQLGRELLNGRFLQLALTCSDLSAAHPMRVRFGKRAARADLERLVAADAGLEPGHLILMIPPPGMKAKSLGNILLVTQEGVVPAAQSAWAEVLGSLVSRHEESWTANAFVRGPISGDALSRLWRALETRTQAFWHPPTDPVEHGEEAPR